MKRFLAVVGPLVAVLVSLLLVHSPWERDAADRRAAENDTPRRLRLADAAGGTAAPDDAEGDGPSSAPRARAPARRLETRGRLAYDDGRPARGVALQLAVGRPLETRQWRNGDTPTKTVWLVPHHRWTVTDRDGGFAYPAVDAPSGARRVLFTEPDQVAWVLAEFEEYRGDVVRAARRVGVKGVLEGRNGKPLGGHEMQVQLGRPEGWDTRTAKEPDSFVTATGDLLVDAYAKSEHVTHGDGSFQLALVAGLSTFTFGPDGADGARVVDIPPRGIDLGDLRLPPERDAGRPAEPVHGMVLDLNGSPLAGAEIKLWAGNMGPPSHTTRTGPDGRFRFAAVKGEQAIAWAISTESPHLYVPTQCSGTVRLPCFTPLVLRAPAASEYCRTTFPGVKGFLVFEREGLFLGGDVSDGTMAVGLPPGRYRIHALTTFGHILRAETVARPGDELRVPLAEFEDVT